LREAGATVQLLLNDFEAQSADWLWKVDADGRIIDPSPRFGDAARRAWQLLENEPLTGLFEPCRETERLSIHLAQRTPFRDLTLPLTLDGSPHWWTLSAQPWQEDARRRARCHCPKTRRSACQPHGPL
jgi:PAS domain-containing protein